MTVEQAILHCNAIKSINDSGQMQRAMEMAIDALTFTEAIEHIDRNLLDGFSKPLVLKALNKQIPQKPIMRWTGDEKIIECPNCKKYQFDLTQGEEFRTYCGYCGQRIDWSTDNDK